MKINTLDNTSISKEYIYLNSNVSKLSAFNSYIKDIIIYKSEIKDHFFTNSNSFATELSSIQSTILGNIDTLEMYSSIIKSYGTNNTYTININGNISSKTNYMNYQFLSNKNKSVLNMQNVLIEVLANNCEGDEWLENNIDDIVYKQNSNKTKLILIDVIDEIEFPIKENFKQNISWETEYMNEMNRRMFYGFGGNLLNRKILKR